MRTRVWKGSLAAMMLALVFAGTGAAPHVRPISTHDEDPGHSSARPFKLKGAGQVDLSTGGFDFSGTATHLGKYTATGTIDLGTGSILGEFTAANGDTLTWTAQFSIGPLGELEATFTFTGGTGRFAGASGSASGPVALDPDFMFLLTLQGTIGY